MKNWLTKIKRLGACSEAVIWARDYDSLDEAWQACERGDWMLWLAGKLSGEPRSEKRKPLVLAACECARLSLPYVPEGETRLLTAIETAEAWARGDDGVTLGQVRNAADAANAANAAAYAAAYAANAANAAAYAAAYAAYAAYAAADAANAAAYTAAYAAYAAANAANAAAYAAARRNTFRSCADIVRKYYPASPEVE